ncbi:MAG: hypothetical protein Kow006_13900 [Gammaproteobacteria bacterium]
MKERMRADDKPSRPVRVGSGTERLCSGALLALALGWGVTVQGAELQVRETSFSEGEWLPHDAAIRIAFSELPPAGPEALRFFIGVHDVSALFVASAPGEYTYQSRIKPLPSGESDLVIHRVVAAEQWEEVARLPIRVLTPAGFEQVRITPRLEINVKSQLDENAVGDAIPPERHTYTDETLSAGFDTSHSRSGLRIESNANIVGASFRQETLRFGELGSDAPKLDLSDYQVTVNSNDLSFSVGHVSYGNHPLLVSGVANRGVVVKKSLGGRGDVSLSSQSGSAITGYNNLLGLKESDHRINALTLGWDFSAARPGGLRVELSYLDASILPEPDFDTGEVVDAEESDGIGLRISGSSESGRLRGDLLVARSRFVNPEDPLLAQGDTLVPVEEEDESARMVEVVYDLIRDKELANGNFASLTAALRHERVDPLYRSVGAFVTPDQISNQFSLEAAVGSVAFQLRYRLAEDNVDDIPTILKTKTKNADVNLSLELSQLLGDSGSSAWPSLSYAYGRSHQYGANQPPDFTDPSHIPDQVNSTHNLSLNWSFPSWDIGYTFSPSKQDNRQPGRENADFETTQHEITLGLRPTDTVSLNFGLGRTRQDNVEEMKINYSRSVNWGFDWRIGERWNLRGNYSVSREDDSLDNAESESYSADTQLSWSFELPGPSDRKLPGQLFIRHALEDNVSQDNIFLFSSAARTWTLSAGLNISFF